MTIASVAALLGLPAGIALWLLFGLTWWGGLLLIVAMSAIAPLLVLAILAFARLFAKDRQMKTESMAQ